MRKLAILFSLFVAVACDSTDDGRQLPDIDVGTQPDMQPTDVGADVPDDDAGDVDAGDDAGDMGPEELAIGLESVATGLTAPVALAAPGDGSGRIFIVEQVGRIRVVDREGNLDPTPFADLSDRLVPLMENFDERGLLGLAFHPDFANNDRLFIFYSAPLRAGAPVGYDHTNVISEFSVDANGDFDPDSERKLIELDHPFFNHNGGTVAFGPDGMLYISIGDGGNRDDVGLGHTEGIGNAQDVSNLYGNILRIDVDSGDPYGIPADNPFVGQQGVDEIYAYGLRNPYRFSFDTGTGRLFVGDAGQDLMEEIDIVELGQNYGWNIKEGSLCFNIDDPLSPLATCADVGPQGNPLIDPIIEFTRPLSAFDMPSEELQTLIESTPIHGLVNVGGHVYRGSAVPELTGRYLFASWSESFGEPAGALFVGTEGEDGSWDAGPLSVDGDPDGSLAHFVLAFGADDEDELYVLTSDELGPSGTSGQVYRIAPVGE